MQISSVAHWNFTRHNSVHPHLRSRAMPEAHAVHGNRVKQQVPAVLTIAGSDSGGGAGIQADLKTLAANGVFGTSATTALTAQNTKGVSGIHSIPAAFVAEQIAAVLDDIPIDVIKTGMLPSVEVEFRTHIIDQFRLTLISSRIGGSRHCEDHCSMLV